MAGVLVAALLSLASLYLPPELGGYADWHDAHSRSTMPLLC